MKYSLGNNQIMICHNYYMLYQMHTFLYQQYLRTSYGIIRNTYTLRISIKKIQNNYMSI